MKKIIGLLVLLILAVTVNAIPSAETDGVAAVKTWANSLVSSGESDFTATGKTRYPSPGFWGGEAVYLMQVDRFNNGDTSNDIHNIPSFQATSNGTDLYRLPDYRNGGDIRGIIQRLDYLKDLGITALWMTPIIKHDGAYHGYNPTDFTEIDPGFGTKEEFRELVQEAHKRNIKVIMDIVINHMGDKNTYYSKAANHYTAADELNAKDWSGASGGSTAQGTLSFGNTFFPPMKSQYFFNRVGANSTADMQGTGPTAVFGDFVDVMLDFDTRNYDFQEVFTTLHKYWVAYADIDGFRLDAAKHVTADFIAYFSTEMRDYAKKIGKDNFYIVGEVAGPADWIAMRTGKMMSDPANPNNHGVIPAGLTNRILTLKDKYLANPKAPYPGMTAAYDFAFSGTSKDVLLNAKNANEVENYYKGEYFTMINAQGDSRLNWNVLEIHDWPRIVKDNKTNPWKSQLAVSYLPLSRGIPVTYYGMEQGFTGVANTANINAGAANSEIIATCGTDTDALKRQDMFISGPWRLGSTVTEINNLNYIGKTKSTVWFDWTTDPFLNRNHQVYKAARKFNWIRQSSNAIKYGSTTFRWGDVATSGILAFSRIDAGKEVLVIVNTASGPLTIPNLRVDNTINAAAGLKYINLTNGAQVAYTGKSGVDSYLYFNGMKIDGNSVMVFALESNLTPWNSYLECYLLKDNPVTPPTIDTSKIYKWSGNVESYPENGKVSSTDDIWLNVETSVIGGISSVNALYSTDNGSTWIPKAAELMTTSKNGNDWWHVNIGKFAINTTIKYKFVITDLVGTVVTNDNKGSFYSAYVSASGAVSYLGGTANLPANGSVTTADDLIISTVTKPIGAPIVVKTVYSVNGGANTTVAMTTDGTTTDSGQKWKANIGKFGASASIKYWIEVYDAAGTNLLASDKGTSGTGYAVSVNGTAKSLSYITNVTNSPVNGYINSTDDLIINAETSPTGAAVTVLVKYTVNGVTTSKTMTKNGVAVTYESYSSFSGTVRVERDKWIANIGKFPSESSIDYYITAVDGFGTEIQSVLIYNAIVKKDTFTTAYTSMYFRGTPNGFALTSPMAITANNTWTLRNVKTGSTTTERFKFDVKGDWTINFGLNGVQGGTDIPLDANSTYDISFNDSTKKYTLTKVTYPTTLTIPVTASTIKSTDTTFALPATGTYSVNGVVSSVPLVWSPALNKTKLGTTVYTGTSNGLSVTYTLTVAEESLTLATSAATINQGDTTFKLPTSATYVNNGSTSTVTVAWTPALDVTKVGETTYTATFGTASTTFKLSILAVLPPKLTLDTTSWGVNQGDTTFSLPATATYTENNIPNLVYVSWAPALDVSKLGTTVYTATYNGVSATFSLVVIPSPIYLSIYPNAAGIIQGNTTFALPTTGSYTANGTTSTVPLTWSPALNTSLVGATVYTATYNSTTAAFTLYVDPYVPAKLMITSSKSTIAKGGTIALPSTGTYTSDNVSGSVTSTVPLTWTPTIDTSIVGDTTYTATYNGVSVTYVLTVTSSFKSTYTTMNFRGTPNNWGATPMTLTADNTWTLKGVKTGTTSTERFKFDVKGDWVTSFGLNGGTSDIPLDANSTYNITFNDITKAYTLTKASVPTLTIATSSGIVLKGDTTFTLPTGVYTVDGVSSIVNMTWTPLLNVNTVGTTVYSGSSQGITLTYTLTVKEPVTPTLKLASSSSTIVKGTPFTLPATGTYTNNLGVASTVNITWSATADPTAVGTITYYGSYSGITVTYSLTVTAAALKSTYTTMNFRGTPNGWVSTPMTLVADYTWSISNVVTGTTTTERFKFDVKGDWTINFGDTNRDNTAEQAGGDIPLLASSTYEIRFNDSTKQIWVIKQ